MTLLATFMFGFAAGSAVIGLAAALDVGPSQRDR